MKKLLMVLAFAGVSVASMAQTEDPVEKYSLATNSFWSNWFIQANVVGTSFWGNQEGSAVKFDKLVKDYRTNLGFSVAIGKWFTPGLGLRTKFNGIWGRSVISENKDTNADKYWTIHEQALFNLSNLLCGYSETRVWNFIPYAGAGISRNMTYNDYAMGLSAGILNTWRLGKHVDLNLDVNYGIFEPDYDGFSRQLVATDRGPKTKDRAINVELGLTFKLGKATWKKVPDVDAIKALSQAQIDALNSQLTDANNENARLKGLLANQRPVEQPRTVVEEKIVSAPVSVFFNLGKSTIASQKDLQNVKDLVSLAKDNSTFVVTGYADSQTGSAEFNQQLSQKRAEAVAQELINLGVSSDKIQTVVGGGFDTLTPPANNRRATVELK